MSSNSASALLLEDEPLIAIDIEMSLDAAGFDVTTVMSCAEAQAVLDATSPDIVIVDIELKDGRSTDVVARLLEANIPFIVHSGDPPGDHQDSPFVRGTWIGKPASADELVLAARAAMRTRLGWSNDRDGLGQWESTASPS